MGQQFVISIPDIYTKEWWDRNKTELNGRWQWDFRMVAAGERYVSCCCHGIVIQQLTHRMRVPRIVLLGERDNTLKRAYGISEVAIPQGKRWKGLWRPPVIGDVFLEYNLEVVTASGTYASGWYRLILEDRPPKVWFKAEEKERRPVAGDWFWAETSWVQALRDFGECCLCATRHEEIDQTVQVVTQEDIDKCGY